MDIFLTAYDGIILGPIAKLLSYILQVLYTVLEKFGIVNIGVCMIAFTFLVNALMLPMQIKQQKFAKMSSIMNPELQELQKKYKNKTDQASQQKMSLEMQAIYQKYGVSPASGCLPMLITFPIVLALYRVIYNIPAYLPQVYDIYEGLARALQSAGATVKDLADMVSSSTYVVANAVTAAEKSSQISYYVDVLGQFNADAWKTLATKYPDISAMINSVANQSRDINSFLTLNIADTPAIKSVSIVIPILSVVTQILSMKISMAGDQPEPDPENQMAASMKMMNNIMPFVSGIMSFMFPIGVGIYWIAGNVFRIFQSIGINLYFSHMDIDAQVEKNVQKTKKRYEKLGLDPDTAVQEIAKQRTSSINKKEAEKKNAANSKQASNSGKAASVAKSSGKPAPSNKKAKNENDTLSGARPAGNTIYKEGSITAYANIMAKTDVDRHNK